MLPTGHSDERQRAAQGPMGVDYVPTEDEKRVFKECNQESFMYRSVPFSVLGMAITQALIARGTLAPSPRFGSLPKVAFAGLTGYLAGKMSYMKECQEKFKRLENSPLGEALRKRSAQPLQQQQHPQGVQSEMSDLNAPSMDAIFQPPAESSSQSRDYGYSDEPPPQPGRADDINPPVQSYMEDDDEPRKKVILYEDLRTKNRENYEVTLTQKAETMLKSPPEREPDRSLPKNEGKKNIYGDTWEE